jgi:pyruvate/2-oxoglutarate dehydrogenase complex dihydrolipoamide dehydrogenase (E3) component
MEHYYLAVIGFGKAGKTLAGKLAALGEKVAMVERDTKMYGGTCINVACIPTKSLVYSSKLAAATMQTADWTSKEAFYLKAINEKRALTGKLREKNYHKLADDTNVKVYDGIGSFKDSHTISIAGENGVEEISADYILIDTGSRPFIPPIKGLGESKRTYVSESMLELEKLPKRLVIIGGGYIGMEFASMFADFGSQVTIIQNENVFLPREDQEIAQAVLTSFVNRHINVIFNAQIQEVVDKKDHSTIVYSVGEETKQIPADAILVATGRRPNISDLQLEKAGIQLTERGAIKTDEHLKTSVSNIYAAGDVVGGLQFTYISLDDYRIIFSDIRGDKKRTNLNRGAVPYSVFINPAFSRVGMTEKEALDKGYQIAVGRLPASAIPKASVIRNPVGLLKVIVDKKDGTILGAHLFCEESFEIINLLKLAIDYKIPYTALRDNIYNHPTMSEGLNDLFAAVK